MKTRSQLLIDCLAIHRVATPEALYTLAYAPHRLQREQFDMDTRHSEYVNILDFGLSKPLIILKPLAQTMTTVPLRYPYSVAEYLSYAAMSSLAAHVVSEGAVWDYPQKQFGRDIRAYSIGEKMTYVAVDPTEEQAQDMSVLAPLVIIQNQSHVEYDISQGMGIQIFQATTLL
jgi:hypothetical protein